MPPDAPNLEPRLPSARRVDGYTFAHAASVDVPALWGRDGEALWVPGESVLQTGPEGVGKSTLLQQLLLGRCGLRREILGLPIVPAAGLVVLLAMDRPAQAARSFRRMVGDDHEDVLRERLAVWRGPIPVNVLEAPPVLADWIESEFPGVSDVFIDSVKDVIPKISDDESGNRYNLARQELLARGIELVENHHQRKEQRGQGAPKSLADVHGSRWITAGAGSVLLLWGEPGDHVVELVHLKQPAEPFGPHKVIHDHVRGTSSLYEPSDLHKTLERTPAGLLVADAARAMFETAMPSANQVERARRKLNRLVERGDAFRQDDFDGSARYFASVTRVTPSVTPLTDGSRTSRNGSTKPHADLTQGHGPHEDRVTPRPVGAGERGVSVSAESVTSDDVDDEPDLSEPDLDADELDRLADVARDMQTELA